MAVLERRPVNASLKLHVTARPANYSRAREWEKFLSLSPWAVDVYKRGMRGCYTTCRPISIVTRASVMQIETRVGRGFLHDVRHPSFSEQRVEKVGQCWPLTDLVLINVDLSKWSTSTVSSVIRSVVISIVGWIWMSFGYFFLKRKRIDSFEIYFLFFRFWNRKFECEIWEESFSVVLMF